MLSVSSNLFGINTNRLLKNTTVSRKRASERLSSGQRVNTAADDAAGLAISEKMRAQIRGLNQALRNVQDGISLAQTAEGAMQEMQNILQRQRELSVQSLNGIYTDSDRDKIQMEIKQLNEEIDSAAQYTEFNTIKLLCHSTLVPSPDGFESNLSIIDLSKVTSVTFFEYTTSLESVTFSVADLLDGEFWIPSAYPPITLGIEEYEFSVNLSANTITSRALYYKAPLGPVTSPSRAPLNNICGVLLNGIDGYDMVSAWAANVVSYTGIDGESLENSLGPADNNFSSFPQNINTADTYITWNFMARKKASEELIVLESPSKLWIQSGANKDQGMYLDLYDLCTEEAGLTDLNVSTIEKAGDALKLLDAALDMVSSCRAKAGAQINRLEHTLKSLDISFENLSSSESRIRDADMAREMMNLVKANVMQQAGVSMLAQAGQYPEAVLQLLR